MTNPFRCVSWSAALMSALFFLGSVAEAAIWRVPGDFFSMSNAISDSIRVAPGDTIRVVGNGGALYRERSVVTRPLRIEGGWRADFQVQDPSIYVSVVRDPADTFEQPLIRIQDAGNVVFDGFTLIGGRRGVEVTNTNVQITRCTIRGQRNLPSQDNPQLNVPGAGIRVVGGSALIRDVEIRETTSPYGGGGVGMVNGAQVTMIDCLIDNVFSAQAGINGSGSGISAVNCGNLSLEGCDLTHGINGNDAGLILARNTPFSAVDCTFTFGVASVSAGAIMLIDCASARIDGSLIENCNSNNRGGALFIQNCGSLTMTGTSILRNLGKQEGGGLYLEGTPFTFTDCHWEENARDVFPLSVVNKGGAVRAVNSPGTATRCCFVREVAAGWGGAWSNVGGNVQFTDCVFDGARSKIFGGGIHVELAGGASLDRCLFRGCTGLFGGALGASFTAQLNLDHCTLVENSALTSGAGIYLDTGAVATVTSSILADAVQGDQVHCSAASIAVSNSDIWNDLENGRPEFGGSCPDPIGTNGNVSADPLFCAPTGLPPFCEAATPAYSLSPDSPCAGGGVGGTDMGWRPVGCTAVHVHNLDRESWGRLKARYR